MTEKKEKRFRKVLQALMVCTATALSALLFIWGIKIYVETFQIFGIEKIQIVGNRMVDSKKILSLSALKFGEDILGLHTGEVEGRIAGYPFIKRVRVSKILPSTVKIEILERRPLAYITGDELYSVDEDFFVLPPPTLSRRIDLPLITGITLTSKIVPGMKIENKRVMLATWILHQIKSMDPLLYLEISEVHFDRNAEIELFGTEGGTKILLGKKDLLLRLYTLKNFLQQIHRRKDFSAFSYIDLRFRNQVIVKERG
ncbi:MAG: cell division protein FtsQ/DivIB [Fidelibacterota bacterium]